RDRIRYATARARLRIAQPATEVRNTNPNRADRSRSRSRIRRPTGRRQMAAFCRTKNLDLRSNVGGILKLNEHTNLLWSTGRNLVGSTHFTMYFGLQFLTK